MSTSCCNTKSSSWRQFPSKLLAISSLLRVNPRIAQFSQLPRIALSFQDRTHDILSGYSAQIANHVRQLQVHLRQSLLHPQNARPDFTQMFCPLPPIGAKDPNLRSWLERIVQ